MSERIPLVAANWKMNKTVGEAEGFLASLTGRVSEFGATEVVVCPPYTALAAASAIAAGSGIEVCAQNVHEEESGAFTGEVSIPMLADLGVAGAIVGHSERRQLFCETDEALARKVPALLAAGLLPILCCGETESQRDAGETEAVLERQLSADLAQVEDARLADVVIAYEPIWAIGTGRTATPDQAEEAVAFIRGLLAARDARVAAAVRILYGGSVKPGNAAELFARPEIDGGLVGGASLDADDFLAICNAAGSG
ncbi:MAG: triosephosphate isomerase [Solirubrobacterales bacterium]|jgi:triosephosphate isomerase|nr:triosephosphate isomerase [Solirubrobacterales bacterium]